MKIWGLIASAFAFAVCLSVSFAIFEEQLGEFDWRTESIGYITKTLNFDTRLVVATEEGILASLDRNSGDAQWRVALAPGSRVIQIAEADGQIVTLVQQLQGEDALVSVRYWSIADGSLIWDILLSSDNYSVANAGHMELMYAGSSKQVTVLSGNALHVVTLPAAGTTVTSPSYWSWSATSDFLAASITRGVAPQQDNLVLSSLIASTYVASAGREGKRSTAANVRTAVGCFSSNVGPQRVCDGPVAVVLVSAADGRVSLDIFSDNAAPGNFAPSELAAAVSSDGTSGYQLNDVVFAVDSSSTVPAVVVLPFGARAEPQVLPLPAASVETARAFLLASLEGELRPAVAVCGQNTCTVVALNSPPGAGGLWALDVVTTCRGDRDTVWAALHLASYRFHERTISAAQCVLLGIGAQDSALAAAQSLRVGSSATVDLASISISLPRFSGASQQWPFVLAGSSFTSPVHFLSVLPEPNPLKQPSQTSMCPPAVLLVLQSGQTLVVRAATCSPQQGSVGLPAVVPWRRFEALARVRQAMVLPREALQVGSGEEALAGLASMPSYAERLALQAAIVRGYFHRTAASLRGVADHVRYVLSEMVQAAAEGRRPRLVKVTAERAVDKLRTFGFDQTAVLLAHSHTPSVANQQESASGLGVPFSQLGLQLLFLDLLRSSGAARPKEVQRALFLALPSASEGYVADPVVDFIRLVSAPAPARRLQGFTAQSGGDILNSAAQAGVLVVVGTSDGRTIVWSAEGGGLGAQSCSAAEVCNGPSSDAIFPALEVHGAPHSSVSSITAVAAQSGAGTVPAHAILTEGPGGANLVLVSPSPVHLLPQPEYTHSVNRRTGKLAVYMTMGESDLPCSIAAVPEGSATRMSARCVGLQEVASAVLDPSHERIVDVTYPSAHDTIHVRHSILGDDSVLIKYLNPHVVLVTSVSSGPSGNSDEQAEGEVGGAATALAGPAMYWTLLDTVTGKVVLRLQQDSGSLPVHSVIVENHIVSTYWNSKAKRTEMSSTALYDGVIDSTELTPFASSRARSNSAYLASAAATGAGPRSSYSAVTPIALQKTYVLPRAVTALEHTITAHGLSNKNVLMGLQNGQVYSVDLRQIHPRRPFSEPSIAEKTEGLMRYSPFVVLPPQTALTHNYSLPGGVQSLVSVPLHLESSSLVLSFGGGPDIHLNRVMPSQDFDLLSSDFNYYLLVAILLALASAVLMLRSFQQRKHLRTIWA